MVASYLAKKGVDIGKIKMAAYGKEVANILGSKHAIFDLLKLHYLPIVSPNYLPSPLCPPYQTYL